MVATASADSSMLTRAKSQATAGARRLLGVVPMEVVNAVDGWLVVDPAVWSARVVVLEPVWQGACAVV